MADDLDELLDEVESKFCRSVSLSSPSHSSCKEDGSQLQTKRKAEGKGGTRGSSGQEPHKNPEDEDIDALLEDIFDDEYDINMPKATRTHVKNSLPQPASRKCCPVFLGGSSVATGVGTSTSQRACSRLRCTSCDFRVATFDDQEWDPSCDYLFFRNNMPDRERLQAKLKRKRGSRAYACQCSWHSAVALTDLRDRQDLKWVCAKHEA
ncbi:hypothetical protein MATL_G00134610 [Megalops atlanticus]|uniref:Cilia- and flagella-associated protein 418 n=1 Tax=Megalops atlanticus TaxID=7932 RepID=A0A9D3TAT0_MEGAT|nr:hypothetical protein MATL_G00134610 [Megalops atlanticus]